jgi:hypothetical protein
MDFDHLDASKKLRPVATLVERGYSLARLLEEVSKCELVCSNCHRVRSWKRDRIRRGLK